MDASGRGGLADHSFFCDQEAAVGDWQVGWSSLMLGIGYQDNFCHVLLEA